MMFSICRRFYSTNNITVTCLGEELKSQTWRISARNGEGKKQKPLDYDCTGGTNSEI